MSQPSPPEIVRSSVEAFNRDGGQAVLPYLSEDVVWHSAPGWAGRPVYRGHEGALELIAEWTENFVDYEWELGTLAELEDGRVLLLNRHKGRTRDGVPVDAPLGSIWELEGDRVSSVRFVFTWEEAREAAGTEPAEVRSRPR